VLATRHGTTLTMAVRARPADDLAAYNCPLPWRRRERRRTDARGQLHTAHQMLATRTVPWRIRALPPDMTIAMDADFRWRGWSRR
jgi:hypothetical protein